MIEVDITYKRTFAMNRFQLKMLACLTMLIDHIGAALFPQIFALRLIGRLAFPLFAWMIAEGAHYTRDRKRYLIRLIIFAIISQWPFVFAFSEPTFFGYLNIGVTLVLGFCAIWAFDAFPSRVLGLISATLLMTIATLIHCDYGAYGVAMIFLFYVYRTNQPKMLGSQIFLAVIYTLLTYFKPFSPGLGYFSPQFLSLFALSFIYVYNGKKGEDSKWFFYSFYPIHLLIIGLISQFL